MPEVLGAAAFPVCPFGLVFQLDSPWNFCQNGLITKNYGINGLNIKALKQAWASLACSMASCLEAICLRRCGLLVFFLVGWCGGAS